MSDLELQEWPWKDLAEKDAEIARLRAALTLFATEENWNVPGPYPDEWHGPGDESPIEIARRALMGI